MPGKLYDTSLKDVIDNHAVDWARLLGVNNPRNVRLIDADVSTISSAADKALLVEDDGGEIVLHPELQSSYDAKLPKRIWWYNAVFHQRTDKPVLSTAFLLRPQADGPAITGNYEVSALNRPRPVHRFEYNVLKLWQMPVKTLLDGGIGILPLAPLTDDAKEHLPGVLQAIDRRLKIEAGRDDAEKLRAATSILMGLRHSQDIIAHAMKGLWSMWDHILEDSSVIQEFMRRGREERGVKIGEERGVKIGEERVNARLRQILLRVGEKRLGPPDAAIRAAIESLSDSERLASLSERIHEIKAWPELLS